MRNSESQLELYEIFVKIIDCFGTCKLIRIRGNTTCCAGTVTGESILILEWLNATVAMLQKKKKDNYYSTHGTWNHRAWGRIIEYSSRFWYLCLRTLLYKLRTWKRDALDTPCTGRARSRPETGNQNCFRNSYQNLQNHVSTPHKASQKSSELNWLTLTNARYTQFWLTPQRKGRFAQSAMYENEERFLRARKVKLTRKNLSLQSVK